MVIGAGTGRNGPYLAGDPDNLGAVPPDGSERRASRLGREDCIFTILGS